MCFNELELTIENERTAYYILNKLSQLDKYDKEVTEVVVKLINQEYFSIEKYINPISHIFRNLEFSSFKKVVLCIIKNNPFETFSMSFNTYFYSVDKTELDKFVIELLTDNQASKRATGIDMFHQISRNTYKFAIDIVELKPIVQYKLWVSLLTQDFYEPKNRIIALLPLLDSKSELIKESFLCKLEVLSEDYGSHILKILEDNLRKDNPSYGLVTDRVDYYIEEYYTKYVDSKESVLELNPYQTHFKHIKYFNELFNKTKNETIKKGIRKNSIFSVLGANSVQLAKGGGWRFGVNREISQLSKVGIGVNMPRSYFLHPNNYEIEKEFLSRQDWKDEEFLDIKIILDNE